MFKNCLVLYNKPMAQAIFDSMILMCFFQDRFSSMIFPRNFIASVRTMGLLFMNKFGNLSGRLSLWEVYGRKRTLFFLY